MGSDVSNDLELFHAMKQEYIDAATLLWSDHIKIQDTFFIPSNMHHGPPLPSVSDPHPVWSHPNSNPRHGLGIGGCVWPSAFSTVLGSWYRRSLKQSHSQKEENGGCQALGKRGNHVAPCLESATPYCAPTIHGRPQAMHSYQNKALWSPESWNPFVFRQSQNASPFTWWSHWHPINCLQVVASKCQWLWVLPSLSVS